MPVHKKDLFFITMLTNILKNTIRKLFAVESHHVVKISVHTLTGVSFANQQQRIQGASYLPITWTWDGPLPGMSCWWMQVIWCGILRCLQSRRPGPRPLQQLRLRKHKTFKTNRKILVLSRLLKSWNAVKDEIIQLGLMCVMKSRKILEV